MRFEIDEYTRQTSPNLDGSVAHSLVLNPTMSNAPQLYNKLAVSEQGVGPVVVLLHGLFGSADNLGRLAADLATDWRVVALDLPGHGRSQPATNYDLEAMANDVLQALKALGVSQCAIVGHSLGGKVAMQLSTLAEADDALTVQKLVLVDIAPRTYPRHHDAVFAGLNAVPLDATTTRGSADEHLQSTIPDAGTRAFLLKSLRRTESGEWRWQFDLHELEKQYHKLAKSPTFPHVIRCPTLFIKGANSDYILPVDEVAIRAAFAHPSFKVVANTGHWLHAEKPSVFNGLVRRFLAQ